MSVRANEKMMEMAKAFKHSFSSLTPFKIAMTYQYIVNNQIVRESLEEMSFNINMSKTDINHSLRVLQEQGFIDISREKQPFTYTVIK